jgi:hypothetical protein
VSNEFVKIDVKRGTYEIAELLKLIEGHGVVMGGYARYAVSSRSADKIEYPGDLDIYAYSEESFKVIEAQLKTKGFPMLHESKYAVSFGRYPNPSMDDKWVTVTFPYSGPNIQLIKPMIEGRIVTMGSVEDILRNFDFTVARAALITATEAIADKDFEADDKNGVIRIENIHCPISSSLRLNKYAKKGYDASSSEVYKLFLDWDKRGQEWKDSLAGEFTEIDKLVEQLKTLTALVGDQQDGKMKIEGANTKEIREKIADHLRSLYERLNID